MIPFLDHYIIRHLINLGYPKRDHNFDNHPYGASPRTFTFRAQVKVLGFRVPAVSL